MIHDKETTNGNSNGNGIGNGCDLRATSEAKDDGDKSGLLVDGSSSVSVSVSVSGEGTSAEPFKIYQRRKRRKTTNQININNTQFNHKIEAGEGSASDQNIHRLSFDSFPNGSGECSLRRSRNIVLWQMYQSLNGREDGIGECIRNALVTNPESGCASVIKESFDGVERSDNQINNSAREFSHVMSSRLIKQSEGSTISELCGRSFSDILSSQKFSELCGLLLKNFGAVNVEQILDFNALNTKMKNGAYETSPMLYLEDIQQVWTKVQQVGNEIVTIAKSLSDKSMAHYEQFVRKPRAGAFNCEGCGGKADVRNCLVCDSCEEIYHLSCTELIGTQIPPKSWYCASCVSNGKGSPHDNCAVCQKLKAAASASTPLVNGILTNNQSQHVPNVLEPDTYEATEENQGSKICFVCKTEVNIGDIFRTCGHSLCPHKFYHYKCLTNKQLGVCGPCWYCPSCLCRHCLVDKDDDQIVLCDGCDQAYHIYCTTPKLNCIPEGSWFCGKCDRELKRIRTMKRVYESMQKKVKIEEEVLEPEAVGVVVERQEEMNKSGGLDMLVTAAKTLSHQETMELDTLRNII